MVEAEIHEEGNEAIYIHLDVAKEEDWRAVIEAAVGRYGKLDVLVNNAAILIHNSIEETPEEEWDHVMAVNAKGVFLGTKHAIPAMRSAGGGSIINISSVGGWWAVLKARPATPPPREPSAYSPRPPLSSTPRTISGATRSIPVRSTRL